MLNSDVSDEVAPTMKPDEIEVLRKAVPKIEVPADVRDLVYTLRDMLTRSTDIKISDRRLVQSFKILRACALLQGRAQVTKEDLHILSYVFWERLDQVNKVRSIVLSTCNSRMSDLIAYEEIADDVWQASLKSGNLNELVEKLDGMYENAARFTTEEGLRICNMLKDYRMRAEKLLEQRAEFTVLIMQGADNETWFQVGRGTEGLWATAQLRSVKFRHFRKQNYWWQEAWPKKASAADRKLAKRKLRKLIESKLNVRLVFVKM
jgi:hypothetical protein